MTGCLSHCHEVRGSPALFDMVASLYHSLCRRLESRRTLKLELGPSVSSTSLLDNKQPNGSETPQNKLLDSLRVRPKNGDIPRDTRDALSA